MTQQFGLVEVIAGSMFSRKNRGVDQAIAAGDYRQAKVQVFKPVIDDRYAFARVTSHSGADFEAIPVDSSPDIWLNLNLM